MDTSRPLARPEDPPLARCSSWVWQRPGGQGRGYSNATVLVYHGFVLVEPRQLPRWLGRPPPVRYQWPAIVIQRVVWSRRLNFPGVPAILLDIGGRLGSAQVSFGWRDQVAETFRAAGFEVIEDVVRGFEAPRPLRGHPELQGRLPPVVLATRPDNLTE